MAKTNDARAAEALELSKRLHAAVTIARRTPNDPAVWGEVATLAGNVQRRARLLAGMTRGG